MNCYPKRCLLRVKNPVHLSCLYCTLLLHRESSRHTQTEFLSLTQRLVFLPRDGISLDRFKNKTSRQGQQKTGAIYKAEWTKEKHDGRWHIPPAWGRSFLVSFLQMSRHHTTKPCPKRATPWSHSDARWVWWSSSITNGSSAQIRQLRTF